jgi:predicted nucleic acid-binding protein
VLFDTSVLVPAMVDQLSNHPTSFACFRHYTSGQHEGFCSTHALAECYSILTTLPIPTPVTTSDARALVEETMLKRLGILDLDQATYRAAIVELADMGRPGGAIYDALHVHAARSQGCERIYTYNLEHFRALCGDDILVSAP